MIYVLAGWQPEITDLETDPTFKLIEGFEKSTSEWRVLVPNFVPFLRYLLAEFRQNETDNFIKFYKQIHNISDMEALPLVMDDLSLPSDVEKIYVRNHVILVQAGQKFGEVYFNRFGFIKEVHYFEGAFIRKDLFSDFGFIMNSTYFDEANKLVERRYFDEKGQVVLTEKPNGIRVEKANQAEFDSLFYSNMEEIYSEFLLKNLAHFDPRSDRLIVDGNNQQMMKISQRFPYQEAIVYIYVDNQSQLTELKTADYERLLVGRALVTDSLVKYQQLKLLNPLLAVKSRVIPIFTSQLELGASNTVAEQFLYWRIGSINAEFEQLFEQMLNYSLKNKSIRLIIDAVNMNDVGWLKQRAANFVRHTLNIDIASAEYKFFDEYYTAVEEQKLTAILQEQYNSLKESLVDFEAVEYAYKFSQIIQYRVNPDIETFKNDLATLRLYINFRNDNNSFMQAMVLSSGVPIISEHSSIYFAEDLNGKHLKKTEDLLAIMDFYLLGQGNWNKALVEAVKQIEVNGLEQSMEKWQEALYG